MSEALNSNEIEDVLSSIRRLVSDDIRPAGGGAASRPGSEGGKLLLTPALRVVQNDSPAEAARAIDDVVAAVSAGVAQQPDDWEPETGDIAAEAPMIENAEEFWQDAPAVAAYAEAVPQPRAAVEADSSATVDEAFLEPTEAAAPVSAEEGFDELPDPTSDLPGWAQTSGADEAEIARPDPLSGGTLEPDSSWADQAEAAVLQELTGNAPPVDAAAVFPEAGLPEDDLAALPVDEAMLREIVRDVLREELQGPLGERITRNIRKLVRAEIARVMATEQLL